MRISESAGSSVVTNIKFEYLFHITISTISAFFNVSSISKIVHEERYEYKGATLNSTWMYDIRETL